jgi:hypothetical protein
MKKVVGLLVLSSMLLAGAPCMAQEGDDDFGDDGSDLVLDLAAHATEEYAAKCGCDYLSGDDFGDDFPEDEFPGGEDDPGSGVGDAPPGGTPPGFVPPPPPGPGPRRALGAKGSDDDKKADKGIEGCLDKQYAGLRRALKSSGKGIRVLLGDLKGELSGALADEYDNAVEYCVAIEDEEDGDEFDEE